MPTPQLDRDLTATFTHTDEWRPVEPVQATECFDVLRARKGRCAVASTALVELPDTFPGRMNPVPCDGAGEVWKMPSPAATKAMLTRLATGHRRRWTVGTAQSNRYRTRPLSILSDIWGEV